MDAIQKGTQIAYVPRHAEGDLSHPDVEFGFVTSVKEDVAFCRYWSKYSPDELRTKANSEMTPLCLLVVRESHPQSAIDSLLADIEAA